MQLRDYQNQGRDAIRDAFLAGHRQVLYVLPTGGGKTVTFSDMARRAVARGKRVCIMVHRGELRDQISRALEGHPHGVIQAGVRPIPHLPLQVATVQTLVNRLHRIPAPDLIIVDEAHHTTASTYMKILEAFPRARVLGVTATPCRTDGRGLRDAGYTAMVLGPTVSELTERGYLCRARVYVPGGIDTSGVKSTGGDYNRKALATAVNKSRVTGDMVLHYRRYAHKLPAIVFCVSVEDAETVAAAFSQAGYSAASIDGKMKFEERKRRLSGLANGDFNLLMSCDLVSEGVDIPVVSAGLMRRPTQSRALWFQQIGRCLRPAQSKLDAIILDHAGNTLRHGLPDQPQAWTLDAAPDARKPRKPDEDAVSVRICDECLRAHASAPVCPFCGFVYPLKPRTVEEVAGDLMLLDEAYERAGRRLEERQARTFEDFERIGQERGYKPGWARYRWQLRQRRVSA